MGFLGVAYQMAVVAIPVAVGYALRRLSVMDELLDERLVALILDMLLPCAVLSSLLSVDTLPSRGELVEVMVLMLVAMAVSWAVSALAARLLRVPAEEGGAYRFAMMFGNVGFIGFPVVSSILGEEAMLDAVIASIPGNVVMFTVGAAMFARASSGGEGKREGLARSLLTPTMIASVLTLACALAGFRSFGVVGDAAHVIGQASTPCALLVTGSSIARYDLAEMLRGARSYVTAACRLVAVPLACATVLRALGPAVPSKVVAVIALVCAMPVATNGVLYSMRSGQGIVPMTRVTFLSVVGSVASIPLVCALLGIC